MSATLEVLIVAGGGGGGGDAGGGGGGGGVVLLNDHILLNQSYNIVVGSGGDVNSNGSNSTFDNMSAIGGGRGGYWRNVAPQIGGSGGGGGSSGGQSGAQGTSTQGCAGGSSSSSFMEGGGGGASENGSNGTPAKGGNGGKGYISNITGNEVYYGGGGGGGCNSGSTAIGIGGPGGGGNGQGAGIASTPGLNGSGGGGGGGYGGSPGTGRSGGSGIVIISYRTDGSDGLLADSTGGTVYTVADKTIHVFTSSGTFTPAYSNYSLTGLSINLDPITNNNSTSFTANANITIGGLTDIVERGFKLQKYDSFTQETISESGIFTTGTFSLPVTGLVKNAKYTLTAFATNSLGISNSSSYTFLANKNIVSELKNYTIQDNYIIHKFTANDTIRFYGYTQAEIYAWGAGGAGGTVGGWSYGAAGGAGGSVNASLPTSDSTYTLVVGGPGLVNSLVSANGGGGVASVNNTDNRYAGAGGGYSGVFSGTVSQANALVIAAGGGGGGSSRAGTGNVGGGGGQDGASPYDGKTAYRGRAGTLIAAGVDASCDSANTAGGQGALRGGNTRVNGYGGGGGGGYFGGSGGGYSESNTMAGGGGGSSFVNTNSISSYNILNGNYTTPGDSLNALRESIYGNAGAVASAGSQGVIIIRYIIEDLVNINQDKFISTDSMEILTDSYSKVSYGNFNVSISKAVLYTVLEPNTAVTSISKMIGYAVLSVPGIVNVSKMVGYVVLNSPSIGINAGNLNISGSTLDISKRDIAFGSMDPVMIIF